MVFQSLKFEIPVAIHPAFGTMALSIAQNGAAPDAPIAVPYQIHWLEGDI